VATFGAEVKMNNSNYRGDGGCSHGHSHEGEHPNSFHHYIEQSQSTMNQNKLQNSQQKIIDLTKQIEKVTKQQSDLIPPHQSATTEGATTSAGDWTQVYQYWNQWEDLDELQNEKKNEINRLNNFIEENNFMGHCNDHTEVRPSLILHPSSSSWKGKEILRTSGVGEITIL
jgi:hypothetical protein